VQYEVEWSAQRNKHAVTKCVGAAPKGAGKGSSGGGGGGGGANANAEPGQSGTVKVFFEEKGFGFITPSGGGDDVFVHKSSLGDLVLTQGQSVTYSRIWNAAKSKFTASEVKSEGGGDGGYGQGGGYGKQADSWGQQSRYEPYGSR